MKRSDELAPLSRDHHQALFVAMKLKRAEADGAEAFLGFIAAHGGDHFRIEEEFLLPAWIASDPGADRALAERVAAEHLEASRGRTPTARPATDAVEIRAVGELLERHVRFEERELFPPSSRVSTSGPSPVGRALRGGSAAGRGAANTRAAPAGRLEKGAS